MRLRILSLPLVQPETERLRAHASRAEHLTVLAAREQGFEIVSINWNAVAVRVQDTARAGTKSFSIPLICSISVFFRV